MCCSLTRCHLLPDSNIRISLRDADLPRCCLRLQAELIGADLTLSITWASGPVPEEPVSVLPSRLQRMLATYCSYVQGQRPRESA